MTFPFGVGLSEQARIGGMARHQVRIEIADPRRDDRVVDVLNGRRAA